MLASFLIAVLSWAKQLKGYFGSQFEGTDWHGISSMGAAGHSAFVVRTWIDDSELRFFFLFSRGPWPMEWGHPHLGWVFSPSPQ